MLNLEAYYKKILLGITTRKLTTSITPKDYLWHSVL